jgi:hypothetical protein
VDYQRIIDTTEEFGLIKEEGLQGIGRGIVEAVTQDNDWVVEIGAGNGETTAFIARCLQELPTTGHQIVTIDTFERSSDVPPFPGTFHGEYDKFVATLQRHGVQEKVVLMNCYSRQAAQVLRGGFALLVVDGSHLYENVSADIQNFIPLLKVGGRVWFDDLERPYNGVIRACREYVCGENGLRVVQVYSRYLLAEKYSQRDKLYPCE